MKNFDFKTFVFKLSEYNLTIEVKAAWHRTYSRCKQFVTAEKKVRAAEAEEQNEKLRSSRASRVKRKKSRKKKKTR